MSHVGHAGGQCPLPQISLMGTRGALDQPIAKKKSFLESVKPRPSSPGCWLTPIAQHFGASAKTGWILASVTALRETQAIEDLHAELRAPGRQAANEVALSWCGFVSPPNEPPVGGKPNHGCGFPRSYLGDLRYGVADRLPTRV